MSTTTTQPQHPDKVKKWLVCLGCGKKMWTDRCHRICKKCRRRHAAGPARTAHHVSLPRGEPLPEGERPSRSFDIS